MNAFPQQPSRPTPRRPLFGTVLQFFNDIFQFFNDILTRIVRLFEKLWINIEELFGAIIQQDSKPSGAIVLFFLIIFVLFSIFLGLAATWPTDGFKIATIVFGGLFFVALPIAVYIEYVRLRHIPIAQKPPFRSSLTYSVVLVWSSIPLIAFLYAFVWYPQLRTDVIVPSADSVGNVLFPSIAIFQRIDWTSQGNLLGNGSKCYLGWYNQTAPPCSTLDPQSLGNTTACDCKELWYNNDQVIENFEWMGVVYRYIAFKSESWLLCNNPTYMMTLQTFFDYNANKARTDSGTINPSLWIAVYDPFLGMQKAFETGFTRMNLVNANGIISINIDLRRREGHNGVSAYDYILGLSSSPDQDLVCDTSTSATYQYSCHLSLFVQIPTFDRTIISTQKALNWAGVAALAGAFFSFAQIVAWIVSGQALYKA